MAGGGANFASRDGDEPEDGEADDRGRGAADDMGFDDDETDSDLDYEDYSDEESDDEIFIRPVLKVVDVCGAAALNIPAVQSFYIRYPTSELCWRFCLSFMS